MTIHIRTSVAVSFGWNTKNILIKYVICKCQNSESIDASVRTSFIYFQDKVRCKGVVHFPNITFSSTDLNINCITGTSVEETLQLINHGPVSVMYKFTWIGESIVIERDARNVEVDGGFYIEIFTIYV